MLAADADTLRAFGLGIAMPGVCLAAGVLTCAALVHRGPEGEVHLLVRLAHRLAALAVGGAIVEVAGVARVFGEGWGDALTDRSPGALLRLLGAGLVVAGLFETPDTRPVGDAGELRWSPAGAGVFAIAGALVALVSFGFDGHTVTRGPRAAHAIASFVHVSAASVWAGGAVGVLAVWLVRRGPDAAPVGELTRAFARWALVALVVAGAAGTLLTLFVVDSAGDLTGTTWGRWLLVKSALVVIAAATAGWALRRTAAAPRPVLPVTAVALVAALVATTFLVRAAPT